MCVHRTLSVIDDSRQYINRDTIIGVTYMKSTSGTVIGMLYPDGHKMFTPLTPSFSSSLKRPVMSILTASTLE